LEFCFGKNVLQNEAMGGWLMCGSPCGLFVFISSAFHRRSAFMPYGDQFKAKIRAANQLVINLIILLAVAHSRSVFIMFLSADFNTTVMSNFVFSTATGKKHYAFFCKKKCECEFHPTQVGTTGFVTSVGLP
jgi:hypothetical protein